MKDFACAYDRSAMLAAETLSEWADELERLGRTPAHRRKSVRAVGELLEFACVEDPAEIRPRTVAKWLASRRWSAKTQRNKLSAVSAWGGFLEFLEVGRNPARGVRTPRPVSGTGADTLTLEEIRRLLDVARRRERTPDGRRTRFGPLASTVYLFAVSTGLRRSEIAAQRWRDIDLGACVLQVSADKSRRRDSIPLPAETVSLLRAWSEWSSGELVFPEVPSDHTLRRDLEAAGISGSGGWHRFRKAAITLRAQRWGDYRELVRFARHRDASTTLRSYDRIRTEELRGVAEALPDLWRVGTGPESDRDRTGIGPGSDRWESEDFPIAKTFDSR